MKTNSFERAVLRILFRVFANSFDTFFRKSIRFSISTRRTLDFIWEKLKKSNSDKLIPDVHYPHLITGIQTTYNNTYLNWEQNSSTGCVALDGCVRCWLLWKTEVEQRWVRLVPGHLTVDCTQWRVLMQPMNCYPMKPGVRHGGMVNWPSHLSRELRGPAFISVSDSREQFIPT